MAKTLPFSVLIDGLFVVEFGFLGRYSFLVVASLTLYSLQGFVLFVATVLSPRSPITLGLRTPPGGWNFSRIPLYLLDSLALGFLLVSGSIA